jgi:hypothetical protein
VKGARQILLVFGSFSPSGGSWAGEQTYKPLLRQGFAFQYWAHLRNSMKKVVFPQPPSHFLIFFFKILKSKYFVKGGREKQEKLRNMPTGVSEVSEDCHK